MECKIRVQYYEKRHIFMALAICLLIASPALLIILPQLIASTVHHTYGLWHVFVPLENYYVYAVSLLFLFSGLVILFIFDIRKWPIILSITCVLISIFAMYIGSQSYKSFSIEGIAYGELFSKTDKKYSWEELDQVIYYENTNERLSEYEFIFTDGNQFKVPDNEYFGDIKKWLYYKLEEIDITIERIKISM